MENSISKNFNIKNILLPAIGALINLLSLLFLKFAQLRPNRIQSGVLVSAHEFFNGYYYILIGLTISICVASIFSRRKAKGMALIATITGVYTISLFLLYGISTTHAVIALGEFGRVSVSAGLWICLLGLYVVVSGILRDGVKQKRVRRLILFFVFVCIIAMFISGVFKDLSVVKEFENRKETILDQTVRHFLLALISVIVAIVVGMPIAFNIYIKNKTNSIMLFLINIGQTVPTLSLLGLIMIPLALISANNEFLLKIGITGFGVAPSIIILIIYALLPIVYNTLAGLKLADKNILEAAKGMGMNKRQVMMKVHIPLSLPVIFGGIRTAFTQSVGNAILAGLIGGGGLGSIIFLGLAQASPDLILLGVIPLIAMAFVIDSLILFIINFIENRKRMRYLKGDTIQNQS